MDVNESSVTVDDDEVSEVKFTKEGDEEEEEEEEEEEITSSAMSCENEVDEMDPVVRCRSNTWACSVSPSR